MAKGVIYKIYFKIFQEKKDSKIKRKKKDNKEEVVLYFEEYKEKVISPSVEWVSDMVASYQVTLNIKFFSSYRRGYSCKVKMDNTSLSITNPMMM